MPEPQDITQSVPMGVIRKFERTPPRLRYRIRVIEAWHRESVELVQQAEAVNVLMERAPGRIFRKVLSGDIESALVEKLFRNVRDQIQELTQTVGELAEVAGMKDDLAGRRGPRRAPHARRPEAEKQPTRTTPPENGKKKPSDEKPDDQTA